MHALRDVSHKQLRQGLIEELRLKRQHKPDRRLFAYVELVGDALRTMSLPVAAGWVPHHQGTVERLAVNGREEANEYPDQSKMFGVVWSLVMDGTWIPRFIPSGASNREGAKGVIQILEFVLTPMGEAVVDGSEPHPRFTGALQRMLQAHPRMDLPIIWRLEDAVACIDHHLARPAIAMIGLAMEHTMVRVEEGTGRSAWITTQAGGRAQAMDRISAVKKGVETYAKAEDQHRLLMALCVAERCRDMRNEAAHAIAEPFSLSEADDLLVTAAHAIDTFHELVVDVNLPSA